MGRNGEGNRGKVESTENVEVGPCVGGLPGVLVAGLIPGQGECCCWSWGPRYGDEVGRAGGQYGGH